MSRVQRVEDLGLQERDAAALGADGATRIRTFRLILLLAQELRTLMDQLLRQDGLTTQQAVLTTIIDTLGEPSIKQAADALGTTHQNVKQLAASLERKGFIRITQDTSDARVRRLATTPKSHTTWQRRAAADQQHVLEWFSDLSQHEAETLLELLLKAEAQARAALETTRERRDTPSTPNP
jgi:DNA-binding MarR family transcriptional regulator